MKILRLLFIVVTIPLFASFSYEPDDTDMTMYTPILMNIFDLPASVFSQDAKAFENPGKIYIYGNYIFIVDTYKGIHVIDNQNAENPQVFCFLHIPGAVDVAVKDNILYADNAIDLVAINISNLPQIEVINRVPKVFPEHTPPDLDWIPSAYSEYNRPLNTVIVAWVKK